MPQAYSDLLCHRKAFPFLKYSLLSFNTSLSSNFPLNHWWLILLLLPALPYLCSCPNVDGLQKSILSSSVFSPHLLSQISLLNFHGFHLFPYSDYSQIYNFKTRSPPLNSKHIFLMLYFYLDISNSFKHMSKWEFFFLSRTVLLWCYPS